LNNSRNETVWSIDIRITTHAGMVSPGTTPPEVDYFELMKL